MALKYFILGLIIVAYVDAECTAGECPPGLCVVGRKLILSDEHLTSAFQ